MENKAKLYITWLVLETEPKPRLHLTKLDLIDKNVHNHG
jgi:hypothetical protein